MTAAGTNRFGQPYTGYVPGHDDLVDPTAAEVIAHAELLASTLNAQPGLAGTRQCTDRDLFTSGIDAAVDALRRVSEELEASRGAALAQGHVELARYAFTHVQTTHNRCTINALNSRFARYELEAAELVRITNAAVTGSCLAGQASPVACTPGPGRVRLRVTDYIGTPDNQDHGCVWHVAEQYTCWDPAQVLLTLIGPPEVARQVRTLATALQHVRRPGQPVREFDEGQRHTAATRAGLSYEGARS